MLNQVFRKNISIKILFNLLEEITIKTENYYIIDYNCYKKFLYKTELKKKFLTTMLEYYHKSKHFYITRKLTYKSFTNMIRHICKNCDVLYTSFIKYNESKYTIIYYIYFGGSGGCAAAENETVAATAPTESSELLANPISGIKLSEMDNFFISEIDSSEEK